MFAPKVGIQEGMQQSTGKLNSLSPGTDHVCGSAHGLLAPYWARKLRYDGLIPVIAKQVSARGGDLGVVWNKGRGIVQLTGATAIIGKGDLFVEF